MKICANCKFFIPIDPLVYSKCLLFPKITRESELMKNKVLIDYLVTGVKTEEFKYNDYYYCSTAREFENMCGIKGNKFINKIEK